MTDGFGLGALWVPGGIRRGQNMVGGTSHEVRRRGRGLRAWNACVGVGLLLSAVGCTVVRPSSTPWTKGRLSRFSHADFTQVLRRFVGADGRLDYAALKVYREPLDTYFKQLSFYSPDSHPRMFPTEAHRLAYWINAYNAAAIKTVLLYYPVRSVSDIRGPIPSNFLIPESGFFLAHRILLGGDTYSLNSLENRVIRDRFQDPRVHFAINYASRGGSKLAREAYVPSRLEEQLERATRYFFSEDRNLWVDHETQTVHLSPILKWYKRDFTSWLERTDPESEASLLAYVELYAPVEKAADLAMAQDYEIEFSDYDWRLNDSNAR